MHRIRATESFGAGFNLSILECKSAALLKKAANLVIGFNLSILECKYKTVDVTLELTSF